MFELFNFAPPVKLVMGLCTGIVFGFLLQKGGLTRFRVIVGQFLWADHTVLRTMLTAVAVGSAGVWALHQMWDVPLHIKSAHLLANAVGGVIFGIGMAVLGYCPGTGVAALGDGSRHAVPGVLGMLAGAAVYAEVYPWMKKTILSIGSYGKITIPEITSLSVWWFVAGMAVMSATVCILLRGRDVMKTS